MTTFALRIKPSVQAELDAAASAEALGHFYTEFQHLERAHVLGQSATAEHVRVHWRMFRFAVRNRMTGEAFGQAWRLVAAAIFTAFGLVPEGNTGGADVSGFRRMTVPQDLRPIIQAARQQPQPERASGRRRLSATVAFAAIAEGPAQPQRSPARLTDKAPSPTRTSGTGKSSVQVRVAPASRCATPRRRPLQDRCGT